MKKYTSSKCSYYINSASTAKHFSNKAAFIGLNFAWKPIYTVPAA